jgi:hypothetical protein
MDYPCQALIVASSCRDFEVALRWLAVGLQVALGWLEGPNPNMISAFCFSESCFPSFSFEECRPSSVPWPPTATGGTIDIKALLMRICFRENDIGSAG